jgi:hypothetical protein
MSKEYKINSFKRLANVVNEDNYQVLAIDLAQVLISYHMQIKVIRESIPEKTIGKKNSQIAKFGFTFIDDGKNDFLGYDLENNETGEVKKIRYPLNK